MWKLSRQEDGEWRETGEVFRGAADEANAFAAMRTAEDGWTYKADEA